MGFRGRGGGNHNHRGFKRSRGSGYNQGPPEEVIEVGYFTHPCEDVIVCRNTSGKIPYFNAGIFFDNKEEIGKVDEIFGGIVENGFTVKLQEGVKANSFNEKQKLYIDPGRLLPINRFLSDSGSKKRGKEQIRGNMRGGRGGNSRGAFRGGRGGYSRGGGSERSGFRGGSEKSGFRGGSEKSGFRGGSRGSFRYSGSSSRGAGFGGKDSGNFRGRGGGGKDFGYKRDAGWHSDAPQNKKIRFED
ncbi:unnamed protein product [Thelazia callipaeda]|uniref:H/ACA ribonucleoprotein complex subunit n=1 Tax=Thelazia callipaeda TaxID=103827 RepID=A0A0N5CUT1_THECL|nr:unnamed protein product [Thelazia callipaeda]